MEGVSRQAPCSCTELLEGRPLQSFPKRSCCLEVSFDILCCLPTKRNCWFWFSPSALCPSGCAVDARRVPCSRRASRSDAWPPRAQTLGRLALRRLAASAHEVSARSLRCGMLRMDVRSRPRSSKLHASSLDANDRRTRLGRPRPREGRVMRAPVSGRNATWLILPVVICLSQRLSHACVSMN